MIRQQQQQTNSSLKLFFPCGVAAPLQNTWQVWILKHFQYAHLLFKFTSRHLYAPIKRNCKKSSCFITVQSRFDLWTYTRESEIYSPRKLYTLQLNVIECFFSSTVAAANNGKALHLIKGFSYTQVFVDPNLAITLRKPNYKVSHDLIWMTTFVTICPFRTFVNEYLK